MKFGREEHLFYACAPTIEKRHRYYAQFGEYDILYFVYGSLKEGKNPLAKADFAGALFKPESKYFTVSL